MLRTTLVTLVLACALASQGFAADREATQTSPAGAGSANAATAEPAPKELAPVER